MLFKKRICPICGHEYEGNGNYALPVINGHCCDVCNGIVTKARSNPAQVNIGKNTWTQVALPEPTPEKVKALIDEVSAISKVVVKRNARIWIN